MAAKQTGTGQKHEKMGNCEKSRQEKGPVKDWKVQKTRVYFFSLSFVLKWTKNQSQTFTAAHVYDRYTRLTLNWVFAGSSIFRFLHQSSSISWLFVGVLLCFLMSLLNFIYVICWWSAPVKIKTSSNKQLLSQKYQFLSKDLHSVKHCGLTVHCFLRQYVTVAQLHPQIIYAQFPQRSVETQRLWY